KRPYFIVLKQTVGVSPAVHIANRRAYVRHLFTVSTSPVSPGPGFLISLKSKNPPLCSGFYPPSSGGNLLFATGAGFEPASGISKLPRPNGQVSVTTIRNSPP